MKRYPGIPEISAASNTGNMDPIISSMEDESATESANEVGAWDARRLVRQHPQEKDAEPFLNMRDA